MIEMLKIQETKLKKICNKLNNNSSVNILEYIMTNNKKNLLSEKDLLKLKLLYLIGKMYFCVPNKTTKIKPMTLFEKTGVKLKSILLDEKISKKIISNLIDEGVLGDIFEKYQELSNKILSNEINIIALFNVLATKDRKTQETYSELLKKYTKKLKRKINLLVVNKKLNLDFIAVNFPYLMQVLPNKEIIKLKILNYLNKWDYKNLFNYLKSVENNLNDEIINYILELLSKKHINLEDFYINLFKSDLNDEIKNKLFDTELIYEKLNGDLTVFTIELGEKLDTKYYKEFTELLGYLTYPKGIWAKKLTKLLIKFEKHLYYIIDKLIKHESFSFCLFLVENKILFKASTPIVKKALLLLYENGFCDEIKKLVIKNKVDVELLLSYNIVSQCTHDLYEILTDILLCF